MTREDRRVLRRMSVAVAVSLLGLWAVGAVYSWLHPVDRKFAHCLSKTLYEYGQCLREAE